MAILLTAIVSVALYLRPVGVVERVVVPWSPDAAATDVAAPSSQPDNLEPA